MKNNFRISIPLAIIITMIAVIYQRSTGPTYPKKFTLDSIKVKLPRSHGGETDAPIELPKINNEMSAVLHYKRYPTADDWTSVTLKDEGNRLTARLPHQPPAGKLTYYLEIKTGKEKTLMGSKLDPIFIRFKGAVPTAILAPHVVCMFLSMLLSVVALIEALYGTKMFKPIGRITLSCLIFGGMVLGPLVQKFAFGVYWAGFPYDWDLTDNKLLVGVLVWLFAVALSVRKARRWPTVIAAVTLFAVYSIPHSMQGSEYDYSKGEVVTDVD